MNGNYGKRRKINQSSRDGAVKGALLGLLAFTVLAVGVFAFMLVSRIADVNNPAVTTDELTNAPVITEAPGENTAPVTDAPPSTDKQTEPVTSPVTDPVTAPVTDPVTDPPSPGERRVSFLACGDNIVHDAVREDAKKRANADNPNYNFYDMYKGVAEEIGEADISFINMEGCVGGASLGYLGYPNFNAPNEIAEAFVKLGFDVVNIANNHTLDYDEAGYVNTIKYFETLPFTTIGGYTKANYNEVRIVEKNGVKIAFLSYTNIMNYDPNTWLPRDLPANSDYIIPFAKDADIKKHISAARAAADFVVVSMHWGTEDAFAPDGEQKRLAQLCADMGADVVVGHHSHTVQPAGWITGKDGNKTFVTYSLGNFISTMHYSQNMAGAMLSLDFVVKEDGTKYVDAPTLIPTVCHYSLNRDALQIYRMSDYTHTLASAHGSTLQNPFSYDMLKRYITDVIPTEFIEW